MIHQAACHEAYTVAQLAVKMWPDSKTDELATEFEELIQRKDAAIFLFVMEDKSIGFAQCQLRYDYVEGTDSSPVGYIEGVYIEEEFRKQGYGKLLISTCEQWARAKGCIELASDCELGNVQSLAFHLRSGFREANRIICFTKKLH